MSHLKSLPGIETRNTNQPSSSTTDHEPSYRDLLDVVQRLFDEREAHKHQMAFAQRTIIELRNQVAHACYLGSCAQDCIAVPEGQNARSEKPVKPKASSTWIQSWLAPSESILAAAEDAWQNGNPQRALTIVEPIMRQEDLTLSERINAKLLFGALLRSSDRHELALRYVEESLTIAKNASDYLLAGKAEFHRGLCYLKLNLFAKSVWCFVLASHTDGHQEQIEINRLHAEERCRELPLGHPGRAIDLKNI